MPERSECYAACACGFGWIVIQDCVSEEGYVVGTFELCIEVARVSEVDESS